MNILLRHSLLFFLLLTLLGVGCQLNKLDELELTENDAEFAIPFVNTTFNMEDILKNLKDETFIEIDSDGLIHARYIGDVLYQDSDDIFNSIRDSLPSTIPLLDSVQKLPLSLPMGLDLDFLVFKGGTIGINYLNTSSEVVTVTFSIPELYVNGQPYERTITSFPSLPGAIPNESLDGAELRATSDSITFKHEAITASGQRINFGFAQFNLGNINFSYAEGYLGQYTQAGTLDTIDIEFFEQWTQGDVYFEDPKITFDIESSFGMPTRTKSQTFKIYTADNNSLDLTGEAITNGIDFNFPSLAEVGQSKKTIYTFNRNNSNIDQVLGSRPIKVAYDVDAIVNPDMNVGIRGFLTDSSFYKVVVDVDLPMHGWASGFATLDTLSLNTTSSLKNVKSAEMKLVVDNGLGITIGVEGFFLDGAGNIIGQLFADGVVQPMKGALVDGQGNVTAPLETITFLPFEGDRMTMLRDAKSLAVKILFSSTDAPNQSVKIFKNQEVKVRAGLRVKTQ